MKIYGFILILVVAGFSQGAWAQRSPLRVHDKPKWFEVTGSGFTSGSTCLVRSVADHQSLGYVEPGYRFLAFGVNSSWITFAYKGKMAYIPADAATESFPDSTPSSEWKSAGETLEQRLTAARERSKTGPLAPNFTNNPTPKPTAAAQGAVGSGGGGGRGKGGGQSSSYM